jgi:hypothetical protein
MRRFKYTGQLIGGYHGDVFTPTSLDNYNFSVLGDFIQ